MPNPVPLYLPGDSVVHRLGAGTKLLVLLTAGVALALWRSPWQVGVALALVLFGYAVARLPLRTLLRQVVSLAWIAVPLLVIQWIFASWEIGVGVVGSFVTLVLLAGLVTLTTRTTAMIDVVVRAAGWLRRLGVDPERVGLMLALGIRSVHVVLGLAEEVREAQYARGLRASPRAFAVPLIVRSLRHADRLGEALTARGVDD
ncbi:energy-coupling factor transporter transmembrane component T family protein [Knoellia subterranea]|uniref:Cobalt ABC transporter n=1 Tax=Knoellia subterranea KCTC 19937 TaxID=1385521 RepID=A0A0A0JJG6_9MICO|nr:energy-coupling factor transporter transmembrane protein EcfT [Knoellia subterranea]KGN36197.1 cobalt ABC transporter [Knoellia subterranea KCTC 19937]